MAELQPRNRSHSLHALQFLDQSLKAVGIVNLNREVAREKAIIGIDRNASQKKFLFLGNDTGDISDNTKVIISHDTECHAILRLSLATPSSLDDSIAETRLQVVGIRAVLMMNLDTSVNRHETEDRVAVDRLTATGKRVVDTLHALVDDKRVVGCLRHMLRVGQ